MDRTEYERLANEYLDTVLRVAVNSCKSYADAEDVTQEVFFKLLNRSEAFEDDDHARKWLIRVTVNTAHDLWRSSWYQRTVPLEKLPEEPTFSTEDKSELFLAVQDLPVKFRQVIHLFYYEDYSTAEIAEILGIKEGAVRTRLLRARRRLKDALKEA